MPSAQGSVESTELNEEARLTALLPASHACTQETWPEDALPGFHSSGRPPRGKAHNGPSGQEAENEAGSRKRVESMRSALVLQRPLNPQEWGCMGRCQGRRQGEAQLPAGQEGGVRSSCHLVRCRAHQGSGRHGRHTDKRFSSLDLSRDPWPQ